MIQINLLPDVKSEYLKSQQTKHMFVVGAILVSIVALALAVLLFAYVQIVQPQYQKSVQNDINKGLEELKSKEKGSEIVTVQSALKSLSSLQDNKLVGSRFLSYLSQLTPQGVLYDDVQIDYSANTITFRGTAPDNKATNLMAANLKSAQFDYTENGEKVSITPFSNLVFSTIARSQQSQAGNLSSFEMTMSFDPIIFKQGIEDPAIRVSVPAASASTPAQFDSREDQPTEQNGEAQ